jgi:hypothetical protein
MKNQIQVSNNSLKKLKVFGKTKYIKKKFKEKRISKAQWIWFGFSQKDTKYLNKIKNIVNKELKGPNFDLHLTIIGPFLNLDKIEIKKLIKISKKIKKFKVELKKYKATEEKFTSLFIQLKKTKKLIFERSKFYKTRYLKQNKKYNPHISLYYGNKNKQEKAKIIKKLPKLKKSIIIDKLFIVDVNEIINKWKIMKTVKLRNEKN